VDWSLLTCARKGHITYAPDEPRLRDRLHVSTPGGDAWRCLRCATFVHGEPHGTGPAAEAPLVPRGKELRDAFIMKFFAVERVFRFLIFGFLAYGVWWFGHNRLTIQAGFNKDLPLLKPIASQIGWDPDKSKIVGSIRHIFTLKPSLLLWVAAGLLAYAIIELIEAVGLWMLKRWGEYFAVVATSFGLPLEIYELSERLTALRAITLLINIGLVLYLLISKRLFGIRGGGKAYEERRRGESVIEVEQAADVPDHSASRPLGNGATT
jgi:uncharacterized membrane protein (DUF2068 family)